MCPYVLGWVLDEANEHFGWSDILQYVFGDFNSLHEALCQGNIENIIDSCNS